MSNQPQRATEKPDFLDGIDEHFQKLMKLSASAKQNGSRSNGRPTGEDQTIPEIISQLHVLSRRQRELVLAYIQSLKQQKGE